MRNLTVAVPDEVHKAARVYAACYNTSVSSIVTDFLYTIRNLVSSSDPATPIEAVNLHCELLRANKVGRANLEPFNTRKLITVFKSLMESGR
jgi:hypothetical protein